MRLSAQIYLQILASLKSDALKDRSKRREPRVGLAGEAEFVTVNEFGNRSAGLVRLRDVSRGGIGLLFNQPMAVKQHFVIRLASHVDEPIWLVCSTAYCRPIESGQFAVGARVIQLLRAEEIHKIEAKTSAAKPSPAKPSPGTTRAQEADISRISKAILG
jgi:hypothetical protein